MRLLKPISDKERKFLITIAFICFTLSVFNFSNHLITKYNAYVSEAQSDLKAKANGVYFSLYTLERAPLNPIFAFVNIFLSGFIFINLYKSKRFLFSCFLSLILFCFFIFLVNETRMLIKVGLEDSSSLIDSLTFLDRIIYKSNYFEFAFYLFVSILLFWQISVLLRMLIKTSQRKFELP